MKKHERLIALLGIIVLTEMTLSSALLILPVNGMNPGVDLDLSWRYTLADATDRHIPFGREIIFTFGPLASVYTQFFLPSQRLAFLTIDFSLVLSFCLALFMSTPRSMRWLSLLLPLLIANLYLSDAFFLVAPWILVPLASAPIRNRRRHAVGLIALSSVLGPLFLVKGTLAIPLAVSLGGAAIAISRRSRLVAVLLPVAAFLSILIAWVASGQRIADFPYYIQRESYVAGGYTDAMSLFGDWSEVAAYIAAAAVLLTTQLLARRGPLMPTITSAVILFVAFKAGFVRHDGHAMIAASTLMLLGFLIFLCHGNIETCTGFIVSLAAWLFIGSHYWSVSPTSDWERMTTTIRNNISALHSTWADPDAFHRRFEAAKTSIAVAAALPPTKGTVDLYPNDQVLLLAANRAYDPRPVIQSYSAYTPQLAALNAEHLDGPHAPETVLLTIDPIDGRYPALEDGPSWPALLGRYEFRGYSQDYAVLDRVAGASAATVERPFSDREHAFGEAITIPSAIPFVWAQMRFHPTLLGRIESFLFKAPVISMDVTTADGMTYRYRLVAGMASAGFLLSPRVTTASDFVALRTTAIDALSKMRVTSITLDQDGSGHPWGEQFDLQLSSLNLATDPHTDDVVLGRREDGPSAAKLPMAGDCTIDSVASETPADQPIATGRKTVAVTGWGLVSSAQGNDGGNLRIAITEAGGRTTYVRGERQSRPDVDAFFHLSHATHAGFRARVDFSDLDGPATLQVVQDGASGPAACGKPVQVVP